MNFREARTFVRTLGLKNKKEWYSYCKSDEKPKGLLSTPNRTYKNTGWVSWGDWLGTHTASNYPREYRSFEKCREFVRALFLKGVREWHVYAKSGTRPNDIPSNPSLLYKGKGWIDWGDFLGVNIKSRNSKIFMGFDEARSFVRSFKLKNHKEWISWCKSDKRPRNIPKNPHLVYVHAGWVSWYDWLGTAKNRSLYLPFQEARKFTHSLSLNQVQEWHSYCKSGSKPRNIPSNARRTYQGKGWISWTDWLGASKKPSQYLSFQEAREFARSLSLKEFRAWRAYWKNNERPKNIPSNPHNVYKKNGWISWPDWLGTSTSPRKREK